MADESINFLTDDDFDRLRAILFWYDNSSQKRLSGPQQRAGAAQPNDLPVTCAVATADWDSGTPNEIEANLCQSDGSLPITQIKPKLYIMFPPPASDSDTPTHCDVKKGDVVSFVWAWDAANQQVCGVLVGRTAAMSMFPIELTQDGGTNATTAGGMVSYTYDVKDYRTGKWIIGTPDPDTGEITTPTATDPTANPHQYKRSAGKVNAATFGMAFMDSGDVVTIVWINEAQPGSGC
jgi:hypothetical protein